MCAAPINNGTNYGVKPVPPAALAAALFLFAVGIVVVVIYGKSQKRAWAPQQTYSFSENSNSGGLNNPCAETVLMAPEAIGGPDGVIGLDETLETQLLSSRQEKDN